MRGGALVSTSRPRTVILKWARSSGFKKTSLYEKASRPVDTVGEGGLLSAWQELLPLRVGQCEVACELLDDIANTVLLRVGCVFQGQEA